MLVSMIKFAIPALGFLPKNELNKEMTTAVGKTYRIESQNLLHLLTTKLKQIFDEVVRKLIYKTTQLYGRGKIT